MTPLTLTLLPTLARVRTYRRGWARYRRAGELETRAERTGDRCASLLARLLRSVVADQIRPLVKARDEASIWLADRAERADVARAERRA